MDSSLAASSSLSGSTRVSNLAPDQTPHLTFSSFPVEIREMIWLESFQSRILCLHTHQRIAPPHRDINGKELKGFQKTAAVTFTCTVLPTSDSCSDNSREPKTPDEVFQAHLDYVQKKQKKSDMGTMALGRISLGPVQLYVCHESRALALKRYQRAFGGIYLIPSSRLNRELWDSRGIADHQEWHRRKLWEKRIWVDFERDVIFVDTLKREHLSQNFRLSLIDPLLLMKKYAKEETRKIGRLAVGGRWVMHSGSNDINQIGLSLMGSKIPSQQFVINIRPGNGREWLTGLDSLEELLLDDSFGNKKGTLRGKALQDYREGAEDVREDALGFLAYGKRVNQDLSWETPEVRVLRWDQWNNLHSTGELRSNHRIVSTQDDSVDLHQTARFESQISSFETQWLFHQTTLYSM
jgi:hypothetical protein